jgi:hypothetical protein
VDDFTDVVLSAQLSDITQADRWFALVCETYEALASEDDQSWDEFCGRLTGAAASEGFPTEAEKFTEYLASVTSAPLDVVAAVSDQGQRGLAEMYREAIAAAQEDGAGQPEEDPAAWNAYLAANGPAWDGTEGSWQPYRDWFLYYAVEAGVQGAADSKTRSRRSLSTASPLALNPPLTTLPSLPKPSTQVLSRNYPRVIPGNGSITSTACYAVAVSDER